MNSGMQEDVALGHEGVALVSYKMGALVIIDSGDTVVASSFSGPSDQVEGSVAEGSVAEVDVGVHGGIENVGTAKIPVAHSIHSPP